MPSLENLTEKLKKYGQEHLLEHIASLDESQRAFFIAQVRSPLPPPALSLFPPSPLTLLGASTPLFLPPYTRERLLK
jgi:hypothetical protein